MDVWDDGMEKSFSVPCLSAFSSEAVFLLEVEFVNSRLGRKPASPSDLPASAPSELGYRPSQAHPACSMGAGTQTPVLC